ncbi:hypothetical protein ACSQ67_024736 [Phaseolus vulgaris]
MILWFVIAISFSGMMERAVAARHLMQTPNLPPILPFPPPLPPKLKDTLLEHPPSATTHHLLSFISNKSLGAMQFRNVEVENKMAVLGCADGGDCRSNMIFVGMREVIEGVRSVRDAWCSVVARKVREKWEKDDNPRYLCLMNPKENSHKCNRKVQLNDLDVQVSIELKGQPQHMDVVRRRLSRETMFIREIE